MAIIGGILLLTGCAAVCCMALAQAARWADEHNPPVKKENTEQ